MPCDVRQWRARIGLFYLSRNQLSSKHVVDEPQLQSSTSVRYLHVCLVLLLGLLIAMLKPADISLVVLVFLIGAARLIPLLILYSIMTLVRNEYRHFFSPRSIIGCTVIIALVLSVMPGLWFTLGGILQPNITVQLLVLSNDIELNPGPGDQRLNLLFANVNSISANDGKRFDDLSFCLIANNVHIGAITESGPKIDVSKYNIDGYHTLDQDLYNPLGRGTILYISENINYKRRRDLEDKNFEVMWIEIKVNHKSTIIGSCYRSPSQTLLIRDQYFSYMDNVIERILNTNVDSIYFGGDFNSRSKMWWIDDINSPEGNKLYDMMVKHSLSQLINEPTRVTPTSKSCLDLVFTSTPGYVISASPQSPILGSDHSKLIVSVGLDIPEDQPVTRRVWNYNITNTNALERAISNHDWQSILRLDDVNLMASTFTDQLFGIFETHIPHQERLARKNDNPWFHDRIKTAINKRDKLYRKYVKKNNITNYRQFKANAENVNALVKESKESFLNNTCESLDEHGSSSKSYWYIIKKLIGNKYSPDIPTLVDSGITASTTEEKAKMFLDKFIKKFKHNYNENELPVCPPKTRMSLDTITINRDMVCKLLNELNVSKSCGNDNISNKMLKMVAEPLSEPLFMLFSKILLNGQFPDSWKLGTLVPIYKNKGSRNAVPNYRPVTLLNTIPKILERIIYDSISKYVLSNNLIFINQSGFLHGHDTQKQLMQIVHMLKANNNNGMETRGIFLDIEGAFDAIPHYLLIHKLRSYGFGPMLIELVHSYLQRRKLRVKVKNSLSQWSNIGDINSGVPQGSILGPLLFLLYINDLPDAVHNCSLFLYADDSSLFFPIPYEADVLVANDIISSDLNRMAAWSKSWKLNFKASKSSEVIFKSSRLPVRHHPTLKLNNETIPRVASHKHLGVILDCHLNFQAHIDKTILKCNNMLNPLKSLKMKLSSRHLERIFMSFIIPHLEYGSLIYSSACQRDLDRIDRVYYRASLLVSGCMFGTSKAKVLKCLGWMTLEDRRNEKMSLMIYDSLNNELPAYLQQSINQYYNPVRNPGLRQHRLFRIPPTLSHDMRRSPIIRAIGAWESIPATIRNIVSRNSFKYNIRIHFRGKKNLLVSTKLKLTRADEINLNKTRCDLIFNSHLYAHNFTTVRNPSCECGNRNQSTKHQLLYCQLHDKARQQLLNDLYTIANLETFFQSLNSEVKVFTLLFGNERLNLQTNSYIITSTARFISSIINLDQIPQ